jgi:hypothetical protein
MMAVKQAGDLVQRITLLPAIPHQSFVRFGVVNPLSILHLQHPPLYTQRLGVAFTG